MVQIKKLLRNRRFLVSAACLVLPVVLAIGVLMYGVYERDLAMQYNVESTQQNGDQDLISADIQNSLGVIERNDNIESDTDQDDSLSIKIEEIESQPVVAAISLSVDTVTEGIKLNWSVSGADVDRGFKVIKSSSMNPVYPGDLAIYLGSAAREYTWNITDGHTYYFRVCQYDGNACGIYSNNAKAIAPLELDDDEMVEDITLKSESNGSISWIIDGTSPNGFKVVWSKTSGPVYPTRDGDRYHYFSSPDTRTDIIDAFDGSGDYYVRVCEYLDGQCGEYSNEIVVGLVEEN